MAARRGRGWVVFLLLLAVFVGGFLALDRYVRGQAEQRASAQISGQLGGAQVTTRLDGWPILLAGVTKQVERVHVTAGDAVVSLKGHTGTVRSIDVTAQGLSPWDNLRQAKAQSLDAAVGLQWGDLGKLVGVPLSYVSGNRVAASLDVQYFGATIQIQAEGDLTVAADGTLAISATTAKVAGVDVPQSIITGALTKLAPGMRLPQPAGVVYDGIGISPDGVTAHLHGANVAVGQLLI